MEAQQVAEVRRFNRLVTQRAGALEDHFLGRDRPLGESRVLYEIGGAGADLRELRSRLDLDSGYLSRLAQSLAGQGLVALRPSDEDERVRRAELTPTGRAELDEMIAEGKPAEVVCNFCNSRYGAPEAELRRIRDELAKAPMGSS